MDKFGRRTFLRLMGEAAALLCIGLSRKKALARTGGKISKKRSKRITVEEHISSGEFADFIATLEGEKQGPMPPMPMKQGGGFQSNVDVIGDIANIDMRLKDMDENGIDMQVLSWRSSTPEHFDVKNGIIWSRKINDTLAELVNRYPGRFAAFSSIPWQDPKAAVAELERAVKELGLKGIKRDGNIKGEYLAGKKYWPVFKKAEELGTPIFIHIGGGGGEPSMKESPEGLGLSMAGETDVTVYAAHLIGSGLFDECPKLKIILGHMGAGLPFWAKRLDDRAGGRLGLKKKPSEYIKENFYVATSGNCYHPALMCCLQAVGADHILFAVDFPSDSNREAVEFMESADISDGDKEKIYHLNAERIFSL